MLLICVQSYLFNTSIHPMKVLTIQAKKFYPSILFQLNLFMWRVRKINPILFYYWNIFGNIGCHSNFIQSVKLISICPKI